MSDGIWAKAGIMTARNMAMATIIIALLIALPTIFWPSDTAPAAIDARMAKMDGLFGAIPDWVKQWMSFQHYVFAGSLLFALWHKEARVYLLAIILSHVISFAEIFHAPVDRLGLGLVSLNHWVWLPAFALLIRNFGQIEKNSPFGLWAMLAIFQLSFSLIFDVRDGLIYIADMLS
jgi:hypothetical protein